MVLFINSSCSAVEVARGTKRLNPGSALALVEPKTIANTVDKHHHSLSSAGSSQAPLCRPWDRGDLMRRLATFKSMTWFAKPKVGEILFKILVLSVRRENKSLGFI